jgi:sodium/pantothenate symporter
MAERSLFRLNRLVIAGLAVVSFALAWWQLVAPDLSVIIFAQLGVYAYFAAAFVPVLFGTFLDDTPLAAAAGAAVAALVVHYGLYTTGQLWFPYYEGVAVKNPGISTALGIVAALLVGGGIYLAARLRRRRREAAG